MLLILVTAAKIHNKKIIGLRLFPFLKWSLRFLTVDATTGNQAFSHDRCNIFPL